MPQQGVGQQLNIIKVVTLQSSDRVFDGDQLRSLTTISGGRRFYGLRVDTGNVAVYDQEHRRLKEITPAREADALTADLQDRVYLANTENNRVHVFGSTGERLGTFPVGRPASLATLSNGNIVVASGGPDN
jgi:sugar lactone lactonase YvrE